VKEKARVEGGGRRRLKVESLKLKEKEGINTEVTKKTPAESRGPRTENTEFTEREGPLVSSLRITWSM
jgi:hypothetical protein